MKAEAPPAKAISTDKPNNRVIIPLYVRVTTEGYLIPIDKKKRRAAHFTGKLTVEYPSYEEELQMKQEATRYYEQYHIQQLDYESLTEARVRRCLVRWDLEESMPALGVKRLHRHLGHLEDDSMEIWKKLPPLIRKAIGMLINDLLGPP